MQRQFFFYIKTCADNVAVEQRIQQFPNQKPLMTWEVRALLRNLNTDFKSGMVPCIAMPEKTQGEA